MYEVLLKAIAIQLRPILMTAVAIMIFSTLYSFVTFRWEQRAQSQYQIDIVIIGIFLLEHSFL